MHVVLCLVDEAMQTLTGWLPTYSHRCTIDTFERVAVRNNNTSVVKTTNRTDCNKDYCPTSWMFKDKQAQVPAGSGVPRSHAGHKSSSKKQVGGK